MTPDPEDTVETTDKRLENLKGRKPFVKGFDPRRNLKGVPKDAIAMRKHMRQIAAELIGSGDTEMTRLDAALRQLWTSRNPAHNKLALQVLDPKILTEQVDVTSNGETITPPKIIEIIKTYKDDTTN
jgi:hypothetical protein